ncbi:LytR/AlgR family response regulator transcription factor [Erythrobacter sp. R86502]|uniref:LytR/AlgR family response regulator transcription factor n=1 Tax=Erythrobacter sp. R86502 TaxID=3093846 RepID=UPI0036D3B0E0
MADRLRTVIVDDEPAAIRRLVRLCAALPVVEVIATASDGTTALDLLHRTSVDLILLDIEMPSMSGMAFSEQLVGYEAAPAIVFVTAYEQFAIQAFSVNAVGYLLKPIDPTLLSATVERVMSQHKKPIAKVPDPVVFWAPYRGALVRLESNDIDRITGEDDYARLHCGNTSYLVAERLYAIEQRLGEESFIRIHRSTLINIQHIAALELDAGSWSVRLSAGERLAVGRSFLSRLRAHLGITK